MIITSELIRMDTVPSELRDMLIFDMNIEEVSIAHLHGFYYRAKLRTNHTDAKFIAEMIANEITHAYKIGGCNNGKLESFKLRSAPMLSGEFRITLESMELSERRCLYFALLLNVDVNLTINLKWDEVKELHRLNAIPDAATDILDSLPRHFKFPYVFWKNEPPERLHDIKKATELAFGCTYDDLKKKFMSMVLVDTSQQAEEFKKHLRGEV